MLNLKETKFKIEYATELLKLITFLLVFTNLPAESTPSAYTNIGTRDFRALIFEIKS
ncbi:MAG: hypothetical protein H0W88_08925 [Parachlamydiaceae bacterium]|nr:hypothetical protein [Parachlamydiaceae bacterium]